MNIEEQVKNVISKRLSIDIDKVKSESRLIEDLKADSLDTVEVVLMLEEQLEMTIPDQHFGDISDVQSVIDLMEKLTYTSQDD
jgi:acyl carrier protein